MLINDSSILNTKPSSSIPQLMNIFIPMWRIVIKQIFLPLLAIAIVMAIENNRLIFRLKITSCASNTLLAADWSVIVSSFKKFLFSARQTNVTFRVRFGCAITTSLWSNNDFYWNKFNVFFWLSAVNRWQSKNKSPGEWRCWRLKVNLNI